MAQSTTLVKGKSLTSKKMPRSGQNEGVTAYVPPEIKQILQEWAEEEDRSLSWLLSRIIIDAVESRERKKKNQDARE